MKAKNVLLTICILIFLAGLIGSLWLIFRPHGQTVQIIQDGTVLYTIDLEKSEDQTIEVEYQGSRNIIQIQDHQICVIDAECPDHTCVKMGELKSSAAPIVCLPNKLVVKFAETDGIDAEVK
ncbi:MAG: NusG domain II-containing protein [Ruminococcus flavefaciens]|nr:NusG domain II-containing protein [Ruminococcus flavefaciens]MCM1362760.1 NusG domain II-containing protein [Clostridiales bacterium]